jgi:predicted flap endonuclease-1-like 5' DNA nuclease
MRLDYPLYGLAIVLFVLAAVSYSLISEQYSRMLFVFSSVAIGFLSAVCGYVLRPKAEKPSVVTHPELNSKVGRRQQVMAPTETTVREPVEKTKFSSEPLETFTDVIETKTIGSEAKEASSIHTSTAPEVVSSTNELFQIRGINSKRSEQLRFNGINSLSDLAGASSSDLAAKLDISEKIVKMWIGSAKKLVK